jgi:hypothetical protein
VHALRILFNCAFRLADSLGPSWVLVVEVLCTLDRLLPAAGAGGGAKVWTAASKYSYHRAGLLVELAMHEVLVCGSVQG